MQHQLSERLLEPFSAQEVKWKTQVVHGNRAMAVAYVDARAVEDRLDAVFGVDGWQDSYDLLPDGNVVCKLRVKFSNEWVEKSDVGGQSDQPDEGDRMKSAFSDALKRTAVKLGIGRYLYRLPRQWVDYDPTTRQMRETPRLPDWASPKESARKAGKSINREQWDTIKTNLLQRNALPRRLLEHYQVQKPSELPADKYEEILNLSTNPPQDWQPETAQAA